MEEFEALWLSVCEFCEKNLHRSPPFSWSNREAMLILGQYPAGVTRAVMLTELEHRWRDAVRRGEHSGKLWNVLMNMQLDLADVLSGVLEPKDGFRCRLSCSRDDGSEDMTSIDLIIHRRQFQNFFEFCTAKQFNVLKNRPVVMTEARLLKQKPPILLPARFMNYILDVQKIEDGTKTFMQSVVLPKHQGFFDAATATTLPANSPVFDDNQLLCAEVGAISTPFIHPDSPATRVRIVRLLVSRDAYLGANAPIRAGARRKKLYLILFDDTICLPNMWAVGTMLLVYRPFICSNRDEVLFGSSVQNGAFPVLGIQKTAHSLDHFLIKKAAPMLEGALTDPDTLPLMVQYGEVTVISIIKNMKQQGEPGAEAVPSNPSRFCVGTGLLDKQALLSVCKTLGESISISARLLHIGKGLGNREDGGGASELQSQVRILWMQPLLKSSPRGRGEVLLRVECPRNAIESLQKHTTKHVLPGQLLYWENLRPVAARYPPSVPGSGTQSESDDPSFQYQYKVPDILGSRFKIEDVLDFSLFGSSEGATVTKVDIGSNYLQAGLSHQQASAAQYHEVVSTAIVKSTLNLSRMTALMHSPSIFMSPALAIAATAATAAVGCVQVVATVSAVRAVAVVEGVIDVTGNSTLYHPSPGHKRRREEDSSIRSSARSNEDDLRRGGIAEEKNEDGSDDRSAWMLTLTDGGSGDHILALLSLHDSIVLTAALDPRSNLANQNMVKKRENMRFSFLLSKIDDVISDYRKLKLKVNKDVSLFRVDACTSTDS